ncbi:MAG: Flp pilus assembly complex ATPase component TadA [Verrucomicrobia bacterium]|jgi:type IV pilus assembly protein PilB|nr:Flp pilus assembly complex ATPase component TadA [Verrucomicrobiota bacterium]MBT7065736.1 Flp pilus assembly complex ATPase component TadA [Verrucomicrobiota bacterium]MBT7699481.1 Flp pilus assembly complex ATPase component TadA [Verrucomicrobiota bacterium]
MKYAPKRRKLGELLVRHGRITPEQLTAYLRTHREQGRPLGQVLVDEEALSPDELTKILGEQLGIPHVWLRKGLVDPRIVHALPKDKALRYQVIPMFRVGGKLALATADPHAVFIFDDVARITGLDVLPVLCRAEDINDAIKECYRENASIDEVMASEEETSIDRVQQEDHLSDLAQKIEGSPVINLANSILARAIRDGASDIHIEPQIGRSVVRIRIDGLLYELMAPKAEIHQAVVSRLKVMAKLDISEHRLPQDGRIQVQLDGRTVDLRFSSMPGVLGEKVVMRVLDRSQALFDLNKLGFDPTMLERFNTLLHNPHGLILTCGPTGSGKTTTLYAALASLNARENNIVTIEDPVEYQFPNINQNQVREGVGLTFARFIKHALRQDPDIMMVGEIRDRETAETAVQAALTGHLVLSTLHTNDSPSTITRLLDMGIEPYLVSSSLLATVTQRLLRTICPDCRTTFYPPEEVVRELGLGDGKSVRLAQGRGCKKCYDSGYRGRLGVYELLECDDELRSLILSRPTVDTLRQHLNRSAPKTLRSEGLRKVMDGFTTLEEVKSIITGAC